MLFRIGATFLILILLLCMVATSGVSQPPSDEVKNIFPFMEFEEGDGWEFVDAFWKGFLSQTQ